MLQFQLHINISDQDVTRVLTDALLALSPDCIAPDEASANVLLLETQIKSPSKPCYTINTSKPLRIAQVIKGLNAAVKQHRPDIVLGQAVLSQRENLLKSGGQDIALTDLEVRVLTYLSTQDDKTATKEDLLTHVWGYNPDVTSHTVETHIYRLRQKHELIEDLIRTTDQGYMLYYNEGDDSGA